MDKFCDQCRNELSAYVDGQLEKEFHQEIQSHLSNCQPCKEELECLTRLTTFLSQSMLVPESSMPDLWCGIEDRMPPVCDLMREELSAYLDGELTPSAQEGVNKHLKDCTECLAEFKLLNATNRLLVKELELPASVKVDLWTGIKARLSDDCALIRSELSSYVDQEVATLRHRTITSHLMDCPDCRVQFNQVSSVGDLIRDSYRPEIPDQFDLWPEIKSKLQVVPFAAKKEAPAQQKFAGRKVYLSAAAAVMIAIVGSLTFWFASPQPAPAETISSERYLIESALLEPTDNAEAVVYEQN